MKLLRQNLLQGLNLLAAVPVVRIELAVGSEELAGAEARARTAARLLAELLPPIPPRSAPSRPAVPVFPEQRSYAPEEMAAHVALALQREFGFEVEFARGLAAAASETRAACFQYGDTALGLAAGMLAVALVDAAWSAAAAPAGSPARDRPRQLLADSIKAMKDRALGVGTRYIVWEGERRGIPWSRLGGNPSVMTVALGHGRKLRRFFGSYSGDTGFIGARLATFKHGASELMRSHGIPVPRQALVDNGDAAVAAARRIGYPVVVKPESADMGHGVRINLTDERAVRDAFAAARVFGSVLVAEQLVGDDCRVSLIRGRMIAAARNIAARVIGDGRSTVEQLIAALNRDPRRSSKDYSAHQTIVVDDDINTTLAAQSLALASIPRAGAVVQLRRWWRPFRDHSTDDLTAIVHPANRAMLERAARLIGLDIAGIDFMTPDISRPWTEVGGAILEINPNPGLNIHVRAGAPDVFRMLVEAFFPPGDDGRIPTAAIIGSPTAARRVAAILSAAGVKAGLATSDGIEIDQALVADKNYSAPTRTQMVLGDPAVEAAVLQFSADRIADYGLGLDKAAVGAVLSLTDAADALADCAALIVNAAAEVVVLNADDPGCVRLVGHSRAKRICWVARGGDQPLIAEHIRGGGLAVTPVERDGIAMIGLWDRGEARALAPAAGTAADRAETMFAAAIAFGLGVPAPMIAAALVRPAPQ